MVSCLDEIYLFDHDDFFRNFVGFNPITSLKIDILLYITLLLYNYILETYPVVNQEYNKIDIQDRHYSFLGLYCFVVIY